MGCVKYVLQEKPFSDLCKTIQAEENYPVHGNDYTENTIIQKYHETTLDILTCSEV